MGFYIEMVLEAYHKLPVLFIYNRSENGIAENKEALEKRAQTFL